MKLDLRSSATRSLSLYFLFSKKSNEIFFTIYILQLHINLFYFDRCNQ